jgi:hypothetical protein
LLLGNSFILGGGNEESGKKSYPIPRNGIGY